MDSPIWLGLEKGAIIEPALRLGKIQVAGYRIQVLIDISGDFAAAYFFVTCNHESCILMP
jgi:hypothetical protein